jgi:hypothetical protein
MAVFDQGLTFSPGGTIAFQGARLSLKVDELTVTKIGRLTKKKVAGLSTLEEAMGCCIVAAMIITNILFFYRKILALLGFRVEEGAAMWRPARKRGTGLRRAARLALPALLLCGSVAYGGMHWDHLTGWMRDAPGCEEVPSGSDCQHHHH